MPRPRKEVSLFGDLPKRADEMQARAEKTIARVRKDAEKALKRAETRAGKARGRAEKALDRAWKSALDMLPTRTRKAVKEFAGRVEKTAADLQRRRKRALKRAEGRRKDLVAGLEERATNAREAVAERLDIASRHDLELLHRRVLSLERRVPRKRARHQAAA
jgi:hypothetical protein